MRMRDVARHFDREPAYDGYTGALLFKCQFSSFDDSAGDGSTNRRRGMSTAPASAIPARKVITLGDQRWVVGEPTDDSFLGEAQRKNYNLKRVTDLMAILTPLQACQAAAGTPAYAQRHYFKDTANALTDAEYDTFWNVFFGVNEAVSEGTFLRDPRNLLYRVRKTYTVSEGFLIAQTDELEADARQSATFSTGAYDQVTDSYAAGTVTVDVVQVKPSKYFHFRTPLESPLRAGDQMVVVPNTVACKPNMEFTMAGREWRIAVAEAATGVYMCLARLK